MDEIQALFLKEKLKHLDKWNAERRRIAALYQENLKHVEQIALPQEIANAESVFHLYVIKTDERDELQNFYQRKYSNAYSLSNSKSFTAIAFVFGLRKK